MPTLGVLWMVVAWKLRHRQQHSRLAWTLAACAVAATLDVPSIGGGLDRLTGVSALDSLAKHLILLYPIRSAVLLADRVAYGEGRPRRTLGDRITVISPAAAVVLVVLFTQMPDRERWLGGPEPGSVSPPGVAYFLVYLTLFATAMWSLLTAGRPARAGTRPGGDRHIEAGLRCLAVGAVFGLLYVTYKVALLVYVSVPGLAGDRPVPMLLHSVESGLLAGSLLCFAVGSVLPVVTSSTTSRGVLRWWRARRLRSLWALYVEASPEDGADLDVGLVTRSERWAIELRDGISAVTRYVPTDAETRVQSFLASRWAAATTPPLLTTAACLELGRQRLLRREPPFDRTTPVLLTEDTATLVALAGVYRDGQDLVSLMEGNTLVVANSEKSLVGPDRWARVVTEVFSPPVLVLVTTVIVAATSASTVARGIGWALLASLFVGAVPYGVILLGVRAGKIGDHNITVRSQRVVPMTIAFASAVAAVVILALLGAPRPLTALVVASAVGLASIAAGSTVWKMSIHVGSAAGTVVVLAITVGAASLIAGIPVLVLVAWARLRLTAHTLRQVIGGGLFGAVIAGVVFTALR